MAVPNEWGKTPPLRGGGESNLTLVTTTGIEISQPISLRTPKL